MAFLKRQRSAPGDEKGKDALDVVFCESTPVENVLQTRKRIRTTSNIGTSAIIRRVSSIFLPRKKPAPPNLKLVDSALNSTPRRLSYSSSRDSLESEDDIRLPSGLGSAVTMLSNPSLPPSPFFPSQDGYPQPQGYQRSRAISSPNLVHSFKSKLHNKSKPRRGSVAANATSRPAAAPANALRILLPPEVLTLVLSHLPRRDLASCARVSRSFAAPVRAVLYACIDFDTLSPAQSEQLLALLVSRSDLTDLVTSFICRKWPPFFLTDAPHDQSGPGPDHRAALLTATFTLALERMSGLVALTLPAFDVALLARHTAFGLRSVTLLHATMSEAGTKALFAWLDGQTNVAALRFPHLEDCPSAKAHGKNGPLALNRAHASPYHLASLATKSIVQSLSPRSASSSSAASSSSQLAAPTLLPNLATLHAPPTLALLLAAPLAAGTDTDSTRRPLTDITLTLSTTLYDGLRPAALMRGLRGATLARLALRFGAGVDRRTVEKVVGAVGAALGAGAAAAEDKDKDKGKGKGKGKKDGEGVKGKKEKGVAKRRKWEGDGLSPFVMPMPMVACAPQVGSVEDSGLGEGKESVGGRENAVNKQEGHGHGRTPSMVAMVPRSPFVGREEDDEPEPDASSGSTFGSTSDSGRRERKESAGGQKNGTTRKWGGMPMVPRSPLVGRDDEDEPELDIAQGSSDESKSMAHVSTLDSDSGYRERKDSAVAKKNAATKKLGGTPMMPRDPLVGRDEEDGPEAEQGTSKASPDGLKSTLSSTTDSSRRERKESTTQKKNATTKKWLPRDPLVGRDEEDEVQPDASKSPDALKSSLRMTSDSGLRERKESVTGKTKVANTREGDGRTMSAIAMAPRDPLVRRDDETEPGPDALKGSSDGLRPVVGLGTNLGDKTHDESTNEKTATKTKWGGNAFVMAMAPRDPPVVRDEESNAESEDSAEPWDGLISLEVAFHAQDGIHSGRGEAVYKSLSASLARYKSLSSLNLCILSAEDASSPTDDKIARDHQKPSAKEQALFDSWTKLCPTLQSITLFSGTKWQKNQTA